jgi:glycosyltransferase involved in cell wall biosynthesis
MIRAAMAAPWISVVIPAYNEERDILGTLTRIRERLERDGRPYEVLVVDNASTDRTADAVAGALGGGRGGGGVTLLRNDANRGKGYSVKRGMLAATGALRLHCDADCAGSFASLPRMLELIEEADLVVGSRLADGARVAQRQPLRRRVVGRTFVGLCRRVLHEPTSDLFCGFKLWRAPAAEATFSRVSLPGWLFDAEAIALARALDFRVAETGIAWDDRDGSRLSMPRVLVPSVRDLLRARSHVRSEAERAGAEGPRSAAAAAADGSA